MPHHGNESEWKEANVTLIGNNYSPVLSKNSYETVTELDKYSTARTLGEDKDDDYVKAIIVDTSLVRQIYKYDTPWNDEFPVVMVTETKNQEDQGKASIKGQGEASIKPDEKEDELYSEVPIEINLNSSSDESGEYIYLFEGSVSAEPKMSNMYGGYSPSQNNESDKGNEGKIINVNAWLNLPHFLCLSRLPSQDLDFKHHMLWFFFCVQRVHLW